ncbi:MAG: hypothetical protein QXF58_06220, partial [Desulfurococcaceae archaeon]
MNERIMELDIERLIRARLGIYDYGDGLKAVGFGDDFLLLKSGDRLYFHETRASELRRYSENILERAIPIYASEVLDVEGKWMDSGLPPNPASELLLIWWFCLGRALRPQP